MQKTFLKLRAYKNDKGKGPKYSWKKFKLEQAITLQPGEYDIDIWENWRDKKVDDRGNTKEQEYLTVEIKEPWKKPDSQATGNPADDMDDNIPF